MSHHDTKVYWKRNIEKLKISYKGDDTVKYVLWND